MAMVAAMAVLAVVSVAGMVIDDRTLLGASVWLKPLKFAVAFALYGATLAWLLSLPHKGNRWTWWLGTLFAATGAVDVAFIAVQAGRGTFSHFNTQTDPINAIGQKIFVSGVPGLFLTSCLIAAIISWQKVADRPTSRAIHAGLGVAVVGMIIGYLMGYLGAQAGTQVVADAYGHSVELAGKHTVGASDAAAGMPITHWSTVGGDLRIPHFLGLHGIQLFLLAAFVLARLGRRYAWLASEQTRATLVGVFAAGYLSVVLLAAWQALRGQPLLHPDAAIWLGLAAIVMACAAAVGIQRAIVSTS